MTRTKSTKWPNKAGTNRNPVQKIISFEGDADSPLTLARDRQGQLYSVQDGKRQPLTVAAAVQFLAEHWADASLSAPDEMTWLFRTVGHALPGQDLTRRINAIADSTGFCRSGVLEECLTEGCAIQERKAVEMMARFNRAHCR